MFIFASVVVPFPLRDVACLQAVVLRVAFTTVLDL